MKMSEHPIEGMMNITMEKIRQMVDVNTIIGDPIISPDGTTIIPVSKVSYGFASGGADFPRKRPDAKEPFGGGSGAGITISPIAFLTVSNGKVELMQIQSYSGYIDRAIEMTPGLIDKISSLFKKNKDKNKDQEKKAISEDK